MAADQSADNYVAHKYLRSPNDYISDIQEDVQGRYDGHVEDAAAEWSLSRALEDRVRDYCLWFKQKFPLETDPNKLAQETLWRTDFRIFFLAYPFSGAEFLRLAEACYDVDKAICGTAKAALKEAQKWRAMDPFEYLVSEELISWWETDLSQLYDDIETDYASRLTNLIRVQNIEAAFYCVRDVLDGDHFTDIAYQWAVDDGWPEAVTIEAKTTARLKLLSTSVKALRAAVERAEQRWQQDGSKTITPSSSGVSTSYQNQEHINEGIRRRIPNLVAAGSGLTSNDSEEPNEVSSSTMPFSSSVEIPPQVHAARGNSTTFPRFQKRIDAFAQEIFRILKPARSHHSRTKFLNFIIHKSTVLCLTLLLSGTSVALIAVSVLHAQTETSQDKPPLDSNFYSTFSQAMLSLLTIYLTVLPPLRSRSLHLRYRSWFWLLLLLSAAASVLSLALYPSQPVTSLMFGYGASFAQVASTLLLVECVERAVNTGVIDGFEMN